MPRRRPTDVRLTDGQIFKCYTDATWLGERTISFDFDESGSSASDNTDDNSGDDNNDNPDNFPAVGDTYQGCYVLAVSTIDETSAELTLLSPPFHFFPDKTKNI
jgi:hypothetical protein